MPSENNRIPETGRSRKRRGQSTQCRVDRGTCSGKRQFAGVPYRAQTLVKGIPADVEVLSQTDLPGSVFGKQLLQVTGPASADRPDRACSGSGCRRSAARTCWPPRGDACRSTAVRSGRAPGRRCRLASRCSPTAVPMVAPAIANTRTTRLTAATPPEARPAEPIREHQRSKSRRSFTTPYPFVVATYLFRVRRGNRITVDRYEGLLRNPLLQLLANPITQLVQWFGNRHAAPIPNSVAANGESDPSELPSLDHECGPRPISNPDH